MALIVAYNGVRILKRSSRLLPARFFNVRGKRGKRPDFANSKRPSDFLSETSAHCRRVGEFYAPLKPLLITLAKEDGIVNFEYFATLRAAVSIKAIK